jgi:hypothetical protein
MKQMISFGDVHPLEPFTSMDSSDERNAIQQSEKYLSKPLITFSSLSKANVTRVNGLKALNVSIEITFTLRSIFIVWSTNLAQKSAIFLLIVSIS